MIIWSGMGKVVPTLAIIAMFIFVPLGMWIWKDAGAAIGVVIAGMVSGLLVFLVASGAEKQAAALVAAGQPVGDNVPGSFFFIPTKMWGLLLPIVGLVLAFMTKSGPTGG
jgi:hypothetical protein